jgi:hypothetical protein
LGQTRLERPGKRPISDEVMKNDQIRGQHTQDVDHRQTWLGEDFTSN